VQTALPSEVPSPDGIYLEPKLVGGNAKTDHKYQFVALDLDGTLLNSNHSVSEATIEYIQKLDAQGFGIMVATGRALATVYETILALNLPHPIPVVCSNGARGVLCQPDESEPSKVATIPLFEVPVPEPVARRTISLAKELGFLSQYYTRDEIFADPSNEVDYRYVDLYKELTGSKTECVDDMMKILEANSLPSKQLVLFPNEDQDRAMLQFEETLGEPEFLIEGKRATIVRGNLGWFLEVLHPDVCKGNGLERMCRTAQVNVPLETVVAFGDGDNDYEFLQMAGLGVGMKNCRPVIKEIADQVIEWTNDEDGVRRTLESLEQSGQLRLPKANC